MVVIQSATYFGWHLSLDAVVGWLGLVPVNVLSVFSRITKRTAPPGTLSPPRWAQFPSMILLQPLYRADTNDRVPHLLCNLDQRNLAHLAFLLLGKLFDAVNDSGGCTDHLFLPISLLKRVVTVSTGRERNPEGRGVQGMTPMTLRASRVPRRSIKVSSSRKHLRSNIDSFTRICRYYTSKNMDSHLQVVHDRVAEASSKNTSTSNVHVLNLCYADLVLW